MKHNSLMLSQNIPSRSNNPTREITPQQNQSAQDTVIRKRSKSYTQVILMQCLKQAERPSHAQTGSYHLWLIEIVQQKYRKAIIPMMIEAKNGEIRDTISRGTFQAALRTEFLQSANMITKRYLRTIMSSEDKRENIQSKMSLTDICMSRTSTYSMQRKLFNMCIYTSSLTCKQSQRVSNMDWRHKTCVPTI